MESNKPFMQKVRLSEDQINQVVIYNVQRYELYFHKDTGYLCISKLSNAAFLEAKSSRDWSEQIEYCNTLALYKHFDPIIKLTCDARTDVNGIYTSPYLTLMITSRYSPELGHITWDFLNRNVIGEKPLTNPYLGLKEDTFSILKREGMSHFEILITSYNTHITVLESLGYGVSNILCSIDCMKDPYAFVELIKRSISYIKINGFKINYIVGLKGDLIRDVKHLYAKNPEHSNLPRRMLLEFMFTREEMRAYVGANYPNITSRKKSKPELINNVLEYEGFI